MKGDIFVVFSIFLILQQITIAVENVNSIEKVENSLTTSTRTEANSRLFPFLFAVVIVSNEKCVSDEGIDGACHAPLDCAKLDGIGKGKCGEGFGICCIFSAQCSNSTRSITIKRNVTHLISPDGNNRRSPCKITIPKQNGICQIRLDFKEFSLAQPTDGNCMEESLTINGADNMDKFSICGTNQPMSHMYLHFGESDAITLNFNALMTNSKYNIQITMIRCDDLAKAPDGCTQFYTEEMGQVQSFNFPMQQLNKQNYMVCVKGVAGSSEITWSPCNMRMSMPITTAMPISNFVISGEDNGGPPMSITDKNCTGDFISFIDMGKYCGTAFTTVTSKAKPYMMWVNFNDEETYSPVGIEVIDPNTGCPPGWSCSLGLGSFCTDKDACDAPPYISAMNDEANTGFCLDYLVK